METEEQQSPGAEDRDQVLADLNAPGAPAANMQPADRRGRAGSRAPAGYTNPPAQSPDTLGVVSVLPLIGMVHSQDTASRMTQAELDRWHQHGRLTVHVLAQNRFFWRGSDDHRRSTKTSDMAQKHNDCSSRISGNQP